MNRRSFFAKVACVWPLSALGGLFKGGRGESPSLDGGVGDVDDTSKEPLVTESLKGYEVLSSNKDVAFADWPSCKGVSVRTQPSWIRLGAHLVIVDVDVDELLRHRSPNSGRLFQVAFHVEVKDGFLVHRRRT